MLTRNDPSGGRHVAAVGAVAGAELVVRRGEVPVGGAQKPSVVVIFCIRSDGHRNRPTIVPATVVFAGADSGARKRLGARRRPGTRS